MVQLGMTFTAGAALEPDAAVDLLGGKGAALARMVALGLPVPPGFTLTTAACHRFLGEGWTDELDAAVAEGIADLEAATGKRLGDPARPLLVSVRSGAPVSMPGMMDTVLDVGMTEDVARGLGAASGDERFGWDTARRFVQSYASVVLGAPDPLIRDASLEHLGDDEGRGLDADGLARATAGFRETLARAGYVVPDHPHQQVRHAVQAVFRSWNCERATVYRRIEGIDDGLGTAATVQMMAFGNLGDRSGTGVAFSRDPSTGAPGVMGDFLAGAQGEDVVAGTHHTLPIAALRDLWPDIADELDRTATLLEHDLTDLADIEFTVEEGTFWLLQVRRGKHSPRAALRMAIDMADDPGFPLTREEALERVAGILADPPTVATASSGPAHGDVLATGLAASPGRAIGAVCTDVDAAIAAEARGEAVILIRRETSPADIAGMAAATGIVTSRGGLVSHAAVVARSWGLPAVVGASRIEIRSDGIGVGDRVVVAGTEITVDGTTGEVLLGAHHADEVEVPEVAVLRSWEREATPASVAEPLRHREDVTAESVERALAVKGMGDPAGIAAVLGGSADAVADHIAALIEAGDVQELPGGRVRPTRALMARVDDRFAQAAARASAHVEPQMEAFHHVNSSFKALVTEWQVRTVDGEQVPNDHTDAEYDAAVIARLRTEVHALIEPIVTSVAAAELRMARYLDRLDAALAAIEAGETDMVAHPLKDSYHTVWFELHEELIRLSGRNRADEAAAGRA